MIRRTVFLTALLFIVAGPALGGDSLARDRVMAGWRDDFQTDQGWHPEEWKVRRPDRRASSEFGPGGAVFHISGSERGMAWTRTFNPVWTDFFPFLEIEYEIENAVLSASQSLIILSDDSTGPITPGATNPENPLASGAVAGLGSVETGNHRIVQDLRDIFRSDRVARITFLLQSGKEPATLRVSNMTFWASDPNKPLDPPAFAPELLKADASGLSLWTESWTPVNLPESSAISSEWVERAFERSWPDDPDVWVSDIPFELIESNQAACVTSVSGAETMAVECPQQGFELALLMGLRAWGYPRPAFARTAIGPREPIFSPHEVAIQIEYEDGTGGLFMPWAVEGKRYAIERLPQAYIVPLNPGKKLARFYIHDRMNYGQVFLLAASVNTGIQRRFPQLITEHPLSVLPEIPPPDNRPTLSTIEGPTRLVLENSWLRFDLDLLHGLTLQNLTLVPYKRQVIAAPVDLLELFDEADRRMTLIRIHHTLDRTETGTRLVCDWRADDSRKPRTVRVQVDIEDTGKILLTPTLFNPQDQPWNLRITYPNLQGCAIASSTQDAWYLLGTRSTTLGNAPVRSNERYSGSYPIQFMDLFDARHGGGLAVMTRDTELMEKYYRFEKDDSGAALAVDFPRLAVSPGEEQALPAGVILPHLKDWHEPFDAYRQWVRETLLAGRADYKMKDQFFCRRDYPLGGTEYLFNVRTMRYESKQLIEETRKTLGGIDMIDISGWAYNETTGRVGNYLNNDLGGMKPLARAARAAHKENVQLGLYFEGYLVDKRAPLAEIALPAWQMMEENGKPKWWPGDMEFYACPAVEAWQEALCNMIVEVSRKSGADAVYLDEFGFSGPGRVCWSPEHGHPVPSNPPFEERKMLERVRDQLDRRAPRVALYCEQMPCDALVRYIDGAFNYGMADANAFQNPIKFQLLRFVFPEVAMIEMVSSGIRPIPAEVDDLHRCFFQGLAFWLKGRGEAWYSPQFRAFAARIAPILKEHAEVFRSPSCTPLIPTLREELYANAFEGKDKRIITLYNNRFGQLTGDLFRTELPSGWKVADLLGNTRAVFRREGNSITVRGSLPPRSAAAFLFTPGDITPIGKVFGQD